MGCLIKYRSGGMAERADLKSARAHPWCSSGMKRRIQGRPPRVGVFRGDITIQAYDHSGLHRVISSAEGGHIKGG